VVEDGAPGVLLSRDSRLAAIFADAPHRCGAPKGFGVYI